MNFITTNVNFRNVNFEIDSGCCTPLRATYSSLVSFLWGDDPVDQWNITMADGQLCKTWSLCICGDLHNLLVVLIGEVRKSVSNLHVCSKPCRLL